MAHGAVNGVDDFGRPGCPGIHEDGSEDGQEDVEEYGRIKKSQPMFGKKVECLVNLQGQTIGLHLRLLR